MAINVEVLGGSLTISHLTEEITDEHHVRLALVYDAFTSTGRTTLHITCDMSVKAINSNKCKFILKLEYHIQFSYQCFISV
jgi:hypothetical protein